MPFIFNTRPVYITRKERTGKKVKTHPHTGMLIEDDDIMASRFRGQVREGALHSLQLDDSTASVHNFFQYMTSNTDRSAIARHNVKVPKIQLNRNLGRAAEPPTNRLLRPDHEPHHRH